MTFGHWCQGDCTYALYIVCKCHLLECPTIFHRANVTSVSVSKRSLLVGWGLRSPAGKLILQHQQPAFRALSFVASMAVGMLKADGAAKQGRLGPRRTGVCCARPVGLAGAPADGMKAVVTSMRDKGS